MAQATGGKRRFFVEIVKPSHYDDDGYVIQWWRTLMPSSSLACVYALARDVADRRALGQDVDLVVNAYDESNMVIPTQEIIRRIKDSGASGVVFLVGVQTNQFPRAMDLARQFRAAGVAVAMGGFHVSGSMAMLSEMPKELREIQALGVTLFAGEAEGRMEALLRDAHCGQLKPVYNYLGDLPDLRRQVTPMLPRELARRYMYFAPFDCGRGCPFKCSFCTIINVQGRRSRWREADEIEGLVRANLAQGIRRFFITDDNLSRNQNWEPIFDRLIHIREQEGVRLKLLIQVDALSHKVPGFIEKATRAGCNRVFVGLESINPENLAAAGKLQNHTSEYRAMLQAWRSRGVVIHGGYILGLPGDTPESIERDIRTIQRELPVDVLEFMMLTPLSGSADHKAMYESGAWMEPDLNKYDGEHVTFHHARMSDAQWRAISERAWHLYYSPQHVETLMRRAKACGAGARHIAHAILCYYAMYRYEHVHPLQCGLMRRKVRTARRPGLPVENPLVFYARRAWEAAKTYLGLGRYFLQLERVRKRVERDPAAGQYTDEALAPGDDLDKAPEAVPLPSIRPVEQVRRVA